MLLYICLVLEIHKRYIEYIYSYILKFLDSHE